MARLPISEQLGRRLRERRYQEALDHPPECSLTELRRSCRRSQADIAATLGVRQLAISRLERRRNPGLGTLGAYVAALGARLELIVRLPGRAVRLCMPDIKAD